MHKSLYEVVLKYRAECFADVLKITNNYECYELEKYDPNYDTFMLSYERYIGKINIEQPRFGNIFPPDVLVEIGLRVWVCPDEDPFIKLRNAIKRYLYCVSDIDSTLMITESINYQMEYSPISQSKFDLNKIEDHFQCLAFD